MIYAAFSMLKKRKKWVIFYFIGIIAGAVLANMGSKMCMKSIKEFSEMIIKGDGSDKTINAVTWNIFCFRIKELVIINVFALTVIWKKFSSVYIMYKGIIFSIAESIMIFVWGGNGIYKYLLITVRYYPVYMFAVIFSMILCENINSEVFESGRIRDRKYKKELILKYVIISAVIVGFLFAESILESNINSRIYV